MPATATAKTTTGPPVSSTAGAVLVALTAGPASAAQIAGLAGIGRSTATKTLASLAADGRVTRSDGGRVGGRRLPDRWSLPAAERTPKPDVGATGNGRASARLGSGELGVLVLAYLRGHPGEHSPTTVAAALGGRSSGAVGNALARLVGRGDAVQTSPAPRRYRASAL